MRHAIRQFPAVIVTTEKNDSRYLDATSEAAFHRSALFLLQERFDAGDYYPDVEPEENAPPVDLDEETIANLPPQSGIRAILERQVSSRNRWLRQRAAYFNWRQHALAALERHDGALAWRCLESRDAHEYEGVRLERIEGFHGEDQVAP